MVSTSRFVVFNLAVILVPLYVHGRLLRGPLGDLVGEIIDGAIDVIVGDTQAPSPGNPTEIPNPTENPTPTETLVSPEEDSPGIIGGTTVDPDDYPFFVVFNTSTGICGGSVVHPDVVMTAAHCVDIVSPTIVRVGATTATNGQATFVSKTILHPEYRRSGLENDIALLMLGSRVSEDIVVNLNRNDNYPTFTNQTLTVLGYGITSLAGGYPAGLQEVRMRHIDYNDCLDALGIEFDRDMYICYDEDAVGICSGDAGGPVLDSRNIQVGISSFVVNSCTSRFPDVGVRVSTYIEWINSKICSDSAVAPSTCPSDEQLSSILEALFNLDFGTAFSLTIQVIVTAIFGGPI